MAEVDVQNPPLGETTCGSLLHQLQKIWDEVGESDEERDKMLLQIDQECLDVYKRKVDQAAKSRSHLLQALADAKHELSTLLASLGEKTFDGIPEKTSGTIKEQLAAIAPTLELLWKQKDERIKEFSDVQTQIQKICGEIAGNNDCTTKQVVDVSDLSLKKLDEFHDQLQGLQKEKSDRLHKVLELVSTVHDLCAVLGIDFYSTVTEVHPSLNDATGVQSKSISNDTLARLAKTVVALKEDKKQRLQKLQELATQLTDLWNLMDTSEEEQGFFDHVTCNISASVDEVNVPGALALDLIEQAEMEVERLDRLKSSRMKEIAFKRQGELEEIFARAHVEIDTQAAREKILALIDSGNVEPSELLADMDNQIVKAKEEALSRKDILDKVEKWMSACEEESWLEDYNRSCKVSFEENGKPGVQSLTSNQEAFPKLFTPYKSERYPMKKDESKLRVFSGTANPALSKEIACYMGLDLGDIKIKRFADGEIYVQLCESVRGCDVFLVQPTCPPANENLMELLVMIDACRRASAKTVTAVIPYFGYARADRKNQGRESISAKLVANLITEAGADRVLACDLHSGQSVGYFDIPVNHIHGQPVILDYLASKTICAEDLVVVSPDVGGVARARAFAKKLSDAPLAIVDKRRHGHNVAEVMNLIGDVKGKVAVMVDDMIDTAGTISKGAALLHHEGAREVYACCTHGVFSPPAIERLSSGLFQEVIITNSIPVSEQNYFPQLTILSVANLVGEAIWRVHDDYAGAFEHFSGLGID